MAVRIIPAGPDGDTFSAEYRNVRVAFIDETAASVTFADGREIPEDVTDEDVGDILLNAGVRYSGSPEVQADRTGVSIAIEDSVSIELVNAANEPVRELVRDGEVVVNPVE